MSVELFGFKQACSCNFTKHENAAAVAAVILWGAQLQLAFPYTGAHMHAFVMILCMKLNMHFCLQACTLHVCRDIPSV